MNCREVAISDRQRRRINTIAADFWLYNSDRIKEAYKNDNFFQVMKGELDDALKHFQEKFPEIPSWVFWESLFNYLNPRFAEIERGV